MNEPVTIPDEAVEAAALSMAQADIRYWERFAPAAQHMHVQQRLAKARAALEAAIPAILAAERERIATAIEAMTPMVSDEWPTTGEWVMRADAARVARGEPKPEPTCGEVFYGYMAPGQVTGMDWSVPRICTLSENHNGSHGYAEDES